MPYFKDDWVKLLTTDGKTFTVSPELLRHSIYINNIIEEALRNDKQVEEPIILPKCSAQVLTQILVFCQYHRFDPILRCDKENEDVNISSWDDEFLKRNEEIPISDLLGAAYELKVHRLVDVGCKAMARSLKVEASQEQIHKIMCIENAPISEEEKKKHLRLALMPPSGQTSIKYEK